MANNLKTALDNMEIIVSNSKMTLSEHASLVTDIQLIRNACFSKKEKTGDGKKKK